MSTKRNPTRISRIEILGQGTRATTPKNRIYDRAQLLSTARKQATNRNVVALGARPGSARNILRQLSRITANATHRRIKTPGTIDKENENPFDSDDDKKDNDLKKLPFKLDIEDSIEEDDSELPVAPTPSALLEASDEDDMEQPTMTFPNLMRTRHNSLRHEEEQSFLQSDPVMPVDDESNSESTFLSERGRRALSEDPTRISRYSFGSICMSDFGSELELRRESDRQPKMAELEGEDGYGETMEDADVGGETELLRGLQQISTCTVEVNTSDEEGPEPVFEVHFDQKDSDQSFEREVQEPEVTVAQAHAVHEQPQLADTIVEVQEPDQDEVPEVLLYEHEAPASRRHTLLESMIATAAETKPRKKQKLNDRGNIVPGLPSSLMKRIIHDSQENSNKRKTTFGKDHIKALEQATEWFFEQASQDLEAYSSHGRRKKRIDADDVLLLMRRQRVLNGRGALRKMAKDWLPRELLNAIDLPDT